MREVLFKAKRTDNKEWVEGYAGFTGNRDAQKCFIMQSMFSKTASTVTYPFYFCCIEVDSSTVCQHIGLTDKNGTKAFESDKIYDPHENRVFTIYWDKETASFCFRDDNGWMNKDIYRLSYCEIIGNIHDKEE